MATVDTKFDLSYNGNPRSDAAILKSLAHGGPLVVHAEHVAASMLPDVLKGAPTEGTKHLPLIILNNSIFPDFVLDPDLGEGGMHFAVDKDRWASVFRNLVEGGLDTTPIKGGEEKAKAFSSTTKGSTWKH